MKKVFLFIAMAVATSGISAQQVYNGNFETWFSRLQPDGWGTWAAAIVNYNVALGDSLNRLAWRDSTTHASYPYPHDTLSVRLVVDTCTFPSQGQITLAGFISLGGAF